MAFEAGRRASPASPKWRNAAVLLLVLLAFGLRLYRLDYQSLWVDEATSARLATLSPRQIVLDRADSLHSPLYFLGLAAWTSLAGQSEFSLRFFSAWMGLLLVPLVCRTCRRLFRDERTSLMAAMLATVSSAGVAYSQEARMYAILPVAYLLVLSFALGGNGPRRPRDWLGLALSESLCLYLHVFSVFLLLAVNVLLFVRFVRRAEWQSRRLWVASQVAVGLSYAPWLLAVWRWGSHVPDKLTRSNWQANPTPFMRARTSDVASSTPSLVLAQDDTVLDRDPGRLFARYPATRWAAGELLIETRDLAVPATLEPLYLLLEVGRDVVRVGEVTVAKESLDWELPNDVRSTCAQVGNVGNLIGYRWAAQPEGSTSGLLTLYWRASSEAPFAESYTVFVHLLGPNGNLLAQDDGLPREGRRPTTTWLPGEVIADQHELQLDSRVQGGQLLVGMYDLRTLERLPTYDCGGERLSNDAIPLSRVSPEGKVFSDGTHSPGMNERRGN